jgi:hypothetical protein
VSALPTDRRCELPPCAGSGLLKVTVDGAERDWAAGALADGEEKTTGRLLALLAGAAVLSAATEASHLACM